MPFLYITLNIFAFAINIYFAIKNFQSKKILTITHFSIFIGLLGIYFSLLIIESGEWIGEQSRYGFLNFSSIYLQLFIFVINYSIYKIKLNNLLTDNNFSKLTINHFSKNQTIVLLSFIIVLLLINTYIVNMYGNGKQDMFGTFKYSRPLILTNMYFNGLIPYFIIRANRNLRKFVIILIIVNGITLFNTFAIFLAIILPIGLVYSKTLISLHKINIPKLDLIKYSLLIIIMLSISLYFKSKQFDNLTYTYDLYQRYVVQGQLFFGSINNQFSGDISSQLQNYFSEFFTRTFHISKEYGFGYLMVLISGDIAVRYIDEMNIRMTGGMPAILIVNFGLFISLIIFRLIIYTYIKYLKFYIQSLFQDNLFLFLIIARLNSSINEFLLMGEYGIFNITFFSLIIIYIITKYIFSQYQNTIVR